MQHPRSNAEGQESCVHTVIIQSCKQQQRPVRAGTMAATGDWWDTPSLVEDEATATGQSLRGR